MNLEILGPRGAGKTTLGKNLSTEFNIKYISLGEIARREMSEETPLGKEMQYFINTKQIYPEGFLTELIQVNLEQAINSHGGFVLDGYPRHEDEANDLVKIISNINSNFDFILSLDLPLESIKERVSKRLICTSCDYHDVKSINTSIQICPNCTTILVPRNDDANDEIERSFFLYQSQIKRVLDILRPIALFGVIDMDGNGEHGHLLSTAIYSIKETLSNIEDL